MGLHQRRVVVVVVVVPDDDDDDVHVGDGRATAVAATRISTTAAGPGPYTVMTPPAAYACSRMHARTHAPAAVARRTCTPTQVNPAWPTSGITSPADRGGARDRSRA